MLLFQLMSDREMALILNLFQTISATIVPHTSVICILLMLPLLAIMMVPFSAYKIQD